MTTTVIRAAGGLLWRPAPGAGPGGDGIEIAVVHRERYDDWSLPKGKLDGREDPLLAGVREVGEETGRLVTVGHRLATVRYDVGNQEKAVRYWAMQDAGPLGDGAIVDVDEVAALEWLTPEAARPRLTYPDDRAVLARFEAVPCADAVVVLVRHARAGKRSEWEGDDRLRPLDARGVRQAEALRPLLAVFRPAVVAAADRSRCEQTVAPLAGLLGLRVESLPALADEAFLADPAAAVATVTALAAASPVSVVCSQGTAIPGLLDDWLPADVRSSLASTETRKAAWWAVGVRAGVPVWADRYDRPTVTSD